MTNLCWPRSYDLLECGSVLIRGLSRKAPERGSEATVVPIIIVPDSIGAPKCSVGVLILRFDSRLETFTNDAEITELLEDLGPEDYM